MQPFPGPRRGVLSSGAQYKHSLTPDQRCLAYSVQTAKLASFPEGLSPPQLLLDRSRISSVWVFVYTFTFFIVGFVYVQTN